MSCRRRLWHPIFTNSGSRQDKTERHSRECIPPITLDTGAKTTPLFCVFVTYLLHCGVGTALLHCAANGVHDFSFTFDINRLPDYLLTLNPTINPIIRHSVMSSTFGIVYVFRKVHEIPRIILLELSC